jgi:hypothetical protein
VRQRGKGAEAVLIVMPYILTNLINLGEITIIVKYSITSNLGRKIEDSGFKLAMPSFLATARPTEV